jgi:hypothetical protein
MKPVKTKNWGPQFGGVSKLMGLKSVATADNERRLRNEVAAHDGSHGYGRHGAQTGWEQQLIRAATKVTPDQAHDPMGVGPKFRRWNGQMSLSKLDGAPVLDLFGDLGDQPTDFRTAAGNVSGGFSTPEAQYLGRARGDAVVNTLTGPAHYCAQYRFKVENRFIRAPLNSVVVVVGSKQAGALYGIGFARRDPRNYPNFSRDFVLRLISAFESRQTWEQIYPVIDATVYKFNVVALARKKVAFPSMEDLAGYLDLDVLWQRNCKLVYRRTHAGTAQTPWRLVTMFPDSDQPGWAPSLFLSPQMKTALQSAGFNKNANDYHWTGLTMSHDGATRRVYPIPPWQA